MLKSKFLILVLCISFIIPSFSSYSANHNIAPNSTAFILIDANSDTVICEKNSDIKLHPASVSKIMTAILAIELGDFSKPYIASHLSVREIGLGGSNASIQAGEEIYLNDLLHLLMLVSANDAANIIAENIAGNISDFKNLMNEKARRIGAKNTNFSNPIGLDVEDGYPDNKTTARDLATITRYAMSNQTFRDIVSKSEFVVPATNRRGARHIKTTNHFLRDINYNKLLYTVNGVKTGYTKAALNTGVFSARNDEGAELICVVMRNGNRTNMFEEIKQLFDYGFTQNSIDLQESFYDIRFRWSKEQINFFFKKGYIKGYGDGSFKPRNEATKEEFISLLMKIKGVIPDENQKYWSKTYIEEAINKGFIDFSWHSDRKDTISRLESILVLSNVIGDDFTINKEKHVSTILDMSNFSNLDANTSNYIIKVYDCGIISGYNGDLFLDNTSTREEMIAMIDNYLKFKSDIN
ncbi:S-layer homology domain-containing protein [Herbivorax sp. ANBcel31]|uniref:S-layer homology domain-containing protein n=1 Tax=Herbivorax sp. ANBcel31 TaxID=3069754 RepID=UPI0027B7D603|nr:S-layer homology domain-containing protein [Herbivorax sp. ANBcel31]MDQ2087001.1 S-layer homology domain-containing protein [Herbivorax sp. ANBcel31]